MNFLDVKKTRKRSIVDTISAVYILETYLNKCKNTMKISIKSYYNLKYK